MIRIRYAILSAIAVGFMSTSLHAQGGCVDSPEAPTAILMLIGAAGVFYGSFVLRKVLRRNGKR
jgi:XrtJ-associated TM-motif-TM protein